MNSIVVPSGVGRIPIKIQTGAGFSSFTADQWKNWVFYFSIIALHDIITGSVMEWHFVLGCRILGTKHITTDNIKLGDALLLQFCRSTEQLFGKECMHLHCHLAECMMDYGPLHSFWCFAFERYNGILGSMPNNNRSIESQLMQRFLTENQALSCSIPDEFCEELLPVFPKIHNTGSVVETLSSAEYNATFNVQKWTLDSLECFIQLPKFSCKCVLNESQIDSLAKLYSTLYLYSLQVTA